jgi:hypothetical protein
MGNRQTQGATPIFQEYGKDELSSLDVYSIPEAPHPRLVCKTTHNLWDLTIRDTSTGLPFPASERWKGKKYCSQSVRLYTPPGGPGVKILLTRDYSIRLLDGTSFEQLAKVGKDGGPHDEGPGHPLGIYAEPGSGTWLITVSESLPSVLMPHVILVL